MAISRPWYDDWKRQCDLALQYLVAWEHINNVNLDIAHDPHQTADYLKVWRKVRDEVYSNVAISKDAPLEKEASNFSMASIMRLIFESNLLEKAGLSESDTKKLIRENDLFSDQAKTYRFTMAQIKKYEQYLQSSKSTRQIAIFQNRKKSYREVLLHFLAIEYSKICVKQYWVRLSKENIYLASITDRNYRHMIAPQSPLETIKRRHKHPFLFSERIIRQLHFLMANGLISMKDSGVEAGCYRIDARTTDFQTVFTAWENIPRAMKHFVQESNDIMEYDEDPILKAAHISYNFVAIHPFPDFNGRMSRLIMNMVLMAEGLPFFAALRGNKKDKHRYVTALRHANRGKITSYACLIARAVNEGFEQLNRNLERAGLPVIEPARD